MQILTLEQVQKSARKYYQAKRLTAQHPKRRQRMCYYQIGHYRCAIGSALSKETLKQAHDLEIQLLADDTSLEALIKAKIIQTNTTEYNLIQEIQWKHDNWAQASQSYGLKHVETKSCERCFLNTIGL
jgi:hypothetical protein